MVFSSSPCYFTYSKLAFDVHTLHRPALWFFFNTTHLPQWQSYGSSPKWIEAGSQPNQACPWWDNNIKVSLCTFLYLGTLMNMSGSSVVYILISILFNKQNLMALLSATPAAPGFNRSTWEYILSRSSNSSSVSLFS